MRWVKAQCSKNGVAIDGESAKLLCEYCLSDMTRIDNETAFADIELLNDNPKSEEVKELLKSIQPTFDPRVLVREENVLDADGNRVLDETGEPKKSVTHAEIVGVDIVKQ